MENTKNLIVETQTPEITPRIIDYAELVKLLQLSIAREMNIAGALEVDSFEEALTSYDTIDREHIISEIGLRFDGALIRFISASVMAMKRRPIVIQASATEGVNGYLPWQSTLESHIRNPDTHDILSGADVRIERTQPAEAITKTMGEAACSQLISTAAA